MTDKIGTKMPRGYAILWLIMTAAYAVWMIFFMSADTYPRSETGITKDIYYPLWVAASCVCLLLFIVYIKKFLFCGTLTKASTVFCFISLIFGCLFITWYGFFKDPFEFTASMIGLEFPWHFKMWGVFSSISVFGNVLYMYKKHNYSNRAGIICGSIGAAAIFVTINVPSAGEELIPTLRCLSHWTCALVFAVFEAAPIVMFLLAKAKTRSKKYIVLLIAFCAILAAMLVLLVTVGKNGVIESLPMWAAYLLLFVVNFTHLFDTKDAPAPAKEPAAVR